jgi:hypothetical protein
MPRAPGAIEVEARHAPVREILQRDHAGFGTVHKHDVLDLGRARLEYPRQELALGNDDAVTRIAEHVMGLLRTRRVVDGERCGTKVHYSSVRERKLRSIGEHQRDRVAATDAQ